MVKKGSHTRTSTMSSASNVTELSMPSERAHWMNRAMLSRAWNEPFVVWVMKGCECGCAPVGPNAMGRTEDGETASLLENHNVNQTYLLAHEC